jgi:alkylation response protein AidB-like acyl-CoA dehydrogenase
MVFKLDKDESEDEQQIRAHAHRFAKEVLRPASIKLDKLDPQSVIAKDSILWDVFKAWYQEGNHVSTQVVSDEKPDSLTPYENCVIFEELGWGASDLAISLGVASFPFELARPIASLTGNQQLLDEVIEPYLKDREGKVIGCWAITEPGHGSDTLGVGTEPFSKPETAGNCRARQDGSDWIISGQKSAWVSNGTIATHALLFCTIEPTMGMSGGGVFVVPLEGPNVKKGLALDKLGQRALNQGEIYFDDVRVPGGFLIGGPDLYPTLLRATLASANSGMGVIFSGLARAAFEEALEYARTRVQGGRPISDHQMIQGKLFNMYKQSKVASIFSKQAFLDNAVHAQAAILNNLTNPNAHIPALASCIASKVMSTQIAFDVANDAIQVFGGIGLSKEMLIEKLFRDARAALIEDGVNEFLSLVGAKQLIESYEP